MILLTQIPALRIATILKSLFFILLLQSCATNHSQFGSKTPAILKDNFDNPKTISHTFYLIGDAGDAIGENAKKLFPILEDRLAKADTSSTLIFLGDNIYPHGMPKSGSIERRSAEEKLAAEIALTKKFKGHTIFIPGNHDWHNGIDGLEAQEKAVNSHFRKKAFLPPNNCAIETVNINGDVALIIIDSQWYLEDWNEHPTINEDCDIKTREQFFTILESELNNSQKKTTLIAMHHPLMSNGVHGGQFSLKKQIFPSESQIPLPIIGTAINFLRKTSGISPQDLQNKKYSALVKRIKTLISDKSNVVVVSGHEHSLQYIDDDNIKQVISGAGSKEEAARAIHENDFSFGQIGYAMLQVLKTGAAKISFFGVDYKGNEGLLFKQQPLLARPKPNLREFPTKFATTKDTSIYTSKMTTKNGGYRFLWGKHYRKYYSMPIKVKAISLDTLYGGLKPMIEGGGHYAKSLRLEDKKGREFVMRALRKSATRFLQSVAFKDQSVEKDFRDTYAENFIMDFYTSSHPYTPLAVANMASRIGVNHTNPRLYYVPKQNTLALFNEEFGNELYLVEEWPMDGFSNLSSFGKPPKIVPTTDVLANLHDDEKYQIDEKAYIRARLFDMLIGDWDRRDDQWHWGEYKEKDKIIYRPIPHDRDQAFTKYDGNLLSILMNIPALRHMRGFSQNLKNVKWFNREAYNLDLAFLTKSDEKAWIEQAQYIMKSLSNADIDKAFDNLPKEVRDGTIAKIQLQLKIRKTHLERYAREYYKVLQKTVLVVGTEKKDKFIITRNGNTTRVQTFRIGKDGEKLIAERTYKSPQTKELWVYGLGDDDFFQVVGNGNKKIKVRLLGGQDKDTYYIKNGKRVNVYDFRSKKNTIINEDKARIVLSDTYENNTYDYEKPKYNVFSGFPLVGFNPDDGVKIGAVVNYTINGFNRFPYTQRHAIRGNYYFATNGFELSYKAIVPHIVGKWDLIFMHCIRVRILPGISSDSETRRPIMITLPDSTITASKSVR
jgi:calcineurin-like phosphoesterase family protein